MLSPKQQSFLKYSDAFLNICDGAVRSGKTHAALRRFTEYAITGPPGDLAVFGKTERTVKSNVVFPLQDMSEPGTIRYVQGSGELHVYGRRCWVIGVNDVRAEEKVRGMTLAGGYMNEVTLYPQPVFDQAIARSISIPGAKFFADCNPDSPHHWLNREYLTEDHPKSYLKRWRFKLEDNPILPAENVEMLKALYGVGSLFYRRNIDGEWVMAEGAIYQQYDERVHVVDEMPGPPERIYIGIDYGTSNATAFIALGLCQGTWYAFDEFVHSGRDTGQQKTDAEYGAEFLAFIQRVGNPYGIVIDPSAASFKVQLRRMGVRGLVDAENDVVDGIRVVSTALTSGKFKILKRCENLRAEFPSYVWDPKKQEKGEDAPLKGSGVRDHALDATRYACMRAFGRPGRHRLAVVR